ncbi:MAG: PPC domain-containing DNA-binding protein [Planctomycetaceae bacterium]
MQTLSDGDVIVLALAEGEEIVACLLEAAAAHGVEGGFVTGIGSVKEAQLAFFDPRKKEYLPRSFVEPMEIGHLAGNLSTLEDQPHAHIHITLAGSDMISFTGHLVRGVVGTACEICVRKMKKGIRRVKDPEAGFHPLKLRQ